MTPPYLAVLLLRALPFTCESTTFYFSNIATFLATLQGQLKVLPVLEASKAALETAHDKLLRVWKQLSEDVSLI